MPVSTAALMVTQRSKMGPLLIFVAQQKLVTLKYSGQEGSPRDGTCGRSRDKAWVNSTNPECLPSASVLDFAL